MPPNPAIQKVINVLGRERGQQLIEETLREIGLRSIDTPNERVRFGNVLIKRGGVLESLGRSIKIQAILHGATDE
jgi:hypothetical protein